MLVSAQPCLEELGFTVDASTNRQVSDGLFDLQSKIDEVPGGVLIQLGANGGATPAELDQIMRILGPDRTVVFTTIQLPDDPTRYTCPAASCVIALTSSAPLPPNERAHTSPPLASSRCTYTSRPPADTSVRSPAPGSKSTDPLKIGRGHV